MRAHRDNADAHQVRSRSKTLATAMATVAAVATLLAAPAMDLRNQGGDLLIWINPALYAGERPDSHAEIPNSAPPGAAQLSWSKEQDPAAVTPRQTSFNDDNYQPRSDVNVLPPPTEQYWYSGGSRYAQAEQVVRKEPWEWLGADRKRHKGRFEWVEHNGAINYASVCRNYQRGSILYRDCRKGAKRTFARMCDHYKPACHAANNFMP